MEDKNISCRDCGTSFVFSVRDQQFYAEKGFENEPQRCRDCRTSRKNQRPGAGGGLRDVRSGVRAVRGLHHGPVPPARRSAGLLPDVLLRDVAASGQGLTPGAGSPAPVRE